MDIQETRYTLNDNSFIQTTSLILLIQSILLTNSSEEHPLSVSEILNSLNQMEIYPDRRRIVDILTQFHTYSQTYPDSIFSVERTKKQKENPRSGYLWYAIPPLDPELVEYVALGISHETRLSSPNLKNLLETIGILGGYETSSLSSHIQVENDHAKRLENNELYPNLKKLTNAIQNETWITFDLGSYTPDMELSSEPIGRDDTKKAFTVLPLKIVARRGKYFLLARFPHKTKIYHFSLEYMLNLKFVSNEEISNKQINETSVPTVHISEMYAQEHLYMYSEPLEIFTIHVKNERTCRNSFFEDFGKEGHITHVTPETFDVEVKANPIAMTQWALHNYNTAKVEGSKQFQEYLQSALLELCSIYNVHCP